MRKTVCFILCILAIVSIALAAGAEGTAVVPVRLLRPVSSGEITVAVGETIAIGYEIGPEDATDKSLEWTSGDPSVAAVDGEGKVTGVSAGTTIVKAVTKDGSNRTIQATVRVPSLKCDPEPVIVSDPAGQTFKVSYYGNDWDGGIDVSAKGKYFEYSVSADGNEADDEVHDLYEDETDEKNG